MQSFIARQLKEQYTVYKAANGIEAIQILDTYYINLIISDVVMPQMNGLNYAESKIRYSVQPYTCYSSDSQTNIHLKWKEWKRELICIWRNLLQ